MNAVAAAAHRNVISEHYFFRDFLFLSSLLTFYQFSFAYFQHLLSETLLDLGSDYKVKLSNCVSFLDLFIYF